MRCPKCGADFRPYKTRDYGHVVVRYRKCRVCGAGARTEERAKRVPNMVQRNNR